MISTLPRRVERHGRGRSDIERVHAVHHRDGHAAVESAINLRRDAVALGAEHDGKLFVVFFNQLIEGDGTGTQSHAGDDVAFVLQELDPNVVNKIAAGAIIVAPVHALKELIENAVDAGATSLDVLAKEGGLKLLQITDNGCGIQVNDFAYAHILARLTCATER